MRLPRLAPNQRLLLGLMLLLVVLSFSLLASVSLGAADIAPSQVYKALFAFDGSRDHLIIRTVRLPRSLIAATVGAALAIAGAIMQGITGNPLASPGILGINAGAALAVVVATATLGSVSVNFYAWFAFGGAATSAITVYFLGSLGKKGTTPLNLVLAGAAVTTLLASITSGILIISQRTLDEIRFWLAGSVAGRDIALLEQVFPYFAVGLILAFALGRQITALSLGEDVARGLGQATAWVKVSAAVSVVLLAGASVAIAGPIGFVGLVVPHVSRLIVGIDYRWILPYAAVFGAILLVLADIGARFLLQPQELPVGLVMPLLGAPVFIYLLRSRVKH